MMEDEPPPSHNTSMAVPISLFYSYRLFDIDDLIQKIMEDDELPRRCKVKEAELLVSELPTRVSEVMKDECSSNSNSVAETCSICMDCLGVGSSNTVVDKELKCSHVFHDRCLAQWLARERTCPLCRTSVVAV